MKKIIVCLIFMLCFVQTGFCRNKKPKQRNGFFFGVPFLFMGIDYFGSENITSDLITKSRIGYSLYGGFIDTDHMGEAFLWTVYYQKKIYKKILEGDEEFKLEMSQPSIFHIKIDYPDDWKDKPNESVAKNISIELAQYLSYTWTVYHEMLTWYEYRSTRFFSEFGSAFSPEDLYSDLLGTTIAVKVLKAGSGFGITPLDVLTDELKNLGIQPKKVVKKAYGMTKSDWWNGKKYPANKIWKRNFDIGLDGFVSPMLVKGIGENAKPKLLPVPKIPTKLGFSIGVKIEPKEKKQRKILLKILGKNSRGKSKKSFIEPVVDFEKIMVQIKKDSEVKLKK